MPVGAVIVRDGEVIGSGRNERELRGDPTAHAEMIALREAARAVGNWRVLDVDPVRDARALRHVRGRDRAGPRAAGGVRRRDPKAGAAGSVLDVLGEPRLNHRPQVQGGLLAEECGDLLRAFFAAGADARRRLSASLS